MGQHPANPRRTGPPKHWRARPARSQLAARLHLALERNLTALYLCGAYSKSLNDWGV